MDYKTGDALAIWPVCFACLFGMFVWPVCLTCLFGRLKLGIYDRPHWSMHGVHVSGALDGWHC